MYFNSLSRLLKAYSVTFALLFCAAFCLQLASMAQAEAQLMCDGYASEAYREFYVNTFKESHDGREPLDDTELCTAVFGSAWIRNPTPEPTPNDLNEGIDSVKAPEDIS
jgi:hypothetical protein